MVQDWNNFFGSEKKWLKTNFINSAIPLKLFQPFRLNRHLTKIGLNLTKKQFIEKKTLYLQS